MKTQLYAILLVVFATMIGSFGPVFFKKAAEKKITSIMSLITNYNLIIGVFMYGVSSIIFIPALKGGELSILFPLVSLSYIWVALLSRFFFDEKITTFKWIGIAMIVIGTFFIGLGM